MTVEPAKFLPIEISSKDYNRIVRFCTRNYTEKTTRIGANSDLFFMCDKKNADYFRAKLSEANEFIRLKCKDCYIDLTLDCFIIKNTSITIKFAKLIDTNNTHFIPKDK